MGVGQPKKRPAKKKKVSSKKETPLAKLARLRAEKAQRAAKKVPATNEAAKRNAAKGKKETASKGVGASQKKILVAKGKKEALLKKPVKLKSFQIDGITIQRKTVGKKTTFLVAGKPINLAAWIQKRTKEREKKQIDTALKPYAAFFKKVKLSEKDRALKLKQLVGKIKARGAVSPNIQTQSAQLAQVALDAKNPTQYKVKSTLPLHYGRILPPRVDTMIIKRPDGTTMVCMRDDGIPGHPYRDLATLKVIYPKKGDAINVVRVSPNRAELMAKKEKDKNKKKKKKLSYGGGGGYSGGRRSGGGGGYSGGGSPSSGPSSSPGNYTKPTSGVDLSKVNLERTPDGWPKNLEVSNVDLPSKRLFCTLIKPKRKPKPGEKIVKIAYFTGKGRSNDYTKWREGQNKLKPPPIVAEAITRRYFSFEAKRAVAEWQAKMAKSGVYPVIAFMSEVHTKSKNPGSSWYRDFYNPGTVQGIYDSVFEHIAKKIPTDSKGEKIRHNRELSVEGHSMAGLSMKKTADYYKDGKLKRVKFLAFNTKDADYWGKASQMYLAEKRGVKLHVTTRRGTRTAPQAFGVIKRFGLVDSSGNSPKYPAQMKDGVYTSSRYPNVIVRVDSLSHGRHPRFINESMASVIGKKKKAQRFATVKTTPIKASGKTVKV